MRFGLLGSHIIHSKSPALFNAAYPNSSDSYQLIDFNNLQEGMEHIKALDYHGVNVTTPFKEEVLKYITTPSEIVKKIDATNLLIFHNDEIYAYNTDYYGVYNSLQHHITDKERALVIGCGGAGRAAALALKDLGLKVTISNRDIKKGEDIAANLNIDYSPRILSLILNSQIIIDTTGSEGWLGANYSQKVVLEAKYNNPSLNRVVIQDGGLYLSGINWLINQAIPSFRIMTGKEPGVEEMKMLASKW